MNPYKIEIEPVPLEIARRWRGGGGWMYQEKCDGEFATLALGASCPGGHRALMAGERMDDGRFIAFDLVELDGGPIVNVSLMGRWRELVALSPLFPASVELVRTGSGAEFLEAVLAAGGEGVVAKDLSCPYGHGVFKAKRAQVYYAVITEKRADGRSGVRVGLLPGPDAIVPQPVSCPDSASSPRRLQDLPDGGWLPARAVFDRVRVGSVVKLTAFGQHASGLLREARFDKDTATSWLVKF